MEKRAVIEEGLTPQSQEPDSIQAAQQMEITRALKEASEASSKLEEHVTKSLSDSVFNKLIPR